MIYRTKLEGGTCKINGIETEQGGWGPGRSTPGLHSCLARRGLAVSRRGSKTYGSVFVATCKTASVAVGMEWSLPPARVSFGTHSQVYGVSRLSRGLRTGCLVLFLFVRIPHPRGPIEIILYEVKHGMAWHGMETPENPRSWWRQPRLARRSWNAPSSVDKGCEVPGFFAKLKFSGVACYK